MERPIVPREIHTIYQGRIFTVQIETITLPKGVELKAEIIRHPGSVVIVPVTDAGEVVLVRQYRHAIGRFAWELPAGLVDLGALEAALREGRLGGAGLDVLPAEPPDPAHPLVQALARREPWLDGRLLLTPHVAWFSAAGRVDLRRKSAETARDYLTQQHLRNCVNRNHLP